MNLAMTSSILCDKPCYTLQESMDVLGSSAPISTTPMNCRTNNHEINIRMCAFTIKLYIGCPSDQDAHAESYAMQSRPGLDPHSGGTALDFFRFEQRKGVEIHEKCFLFKLDCPVMKK